VASGRGDDLGTVVAASAEPCQLLAGSHGPERVPVRPDTGTERWFEPLHARDATGARRRLSDQILAGADVITAPTWLTHRRALLAVGETRQVRAWTAAAVRVGQDAIDEGLEGRERARAADADDDGAEGPPTGRAVPRPRPRLAAVLPALDEGPELDTGRLLPREAASERDYADQAGMLADAAPDLLLVEGQRSPQTLRVAVGAAVGTGLPVWLALSGLERGAVELEALVGLVQELTEGAAVERVLWPRWARDLGTQSPAIGGIVQGTDQVTDGDEASVRDQATAWLERGVRTIGLLDGAVPDRLTPIRAALDEVERDELARWARLEDRWWSHVRRAAAMAPGGPALWLGPPRLASVRDERLPEGFDWLAPERSEVPGLPEGRFRLVVDRLGWTAPHLESLLDRGGVAAIGVAPSSGTGVLAQAAHLRVLVRDDGEPPLVIARRED
jgi:hypothetical protein